MRLSMRFMTEQQQPSSPAPQSQQPPRTSPQSQQPSRPAPPTPWMTGQVLEHSAKPSNFKGAIPQDPTSRG